MGGESRGATSHLTMTSGVLASSVAGDEENEFLQPLAGEENEPEPSIVEQPLPFDPEMLPNRSLTFKGLVAFQHHVGTPWRIFGPKGDFDQVNSFRWHRLPPGIVGFARRERIR